MTLLITITGNGIENINIKEKYTKFNTNNIKNGTKYSVEMQYSEEGANKGLVNCINIKEL